MSNDAEKKSPAVERKCFAPGKRGITVKGLSVLFGKSRGTLYNWINEKSPYYIPDFPRPIRIGKRSILWLEEEVFEYMAKLAKFRDNPGGLDGNCQ